jgi:FdhE protein
MSETRAADLMRQAGERWSTILVDRPDLEAAVSLQRELVRRVIVLDERVAADPMPEIDVLRRFVADKLARRVPMLRGESFAIRRQTFEETLGEFCTRLAEGGAGAAAARIGEALASGQINPASLVSASLARDQHGIRSAAIQMGFAPDLLWLVGELGAGPLARRLQHAIFDPAGDARDALAGWDAGYCPACGSWPAYAEIRRGDRHLRCSFCGADWQPASYRCTYCDEDGEKFVTAAPDMERPDRRLELCGACGGYLKAIPASSPTPFALLPVEDLATVDLDVAAAERGYGRPPLRDFGPARRCS